MSTVSVHWVIFNRFMQGRMQGGHPAHAPLKLEKIRFFGIKSWFFTRNTPKIFAPTSAWHNVFKCAPLAWNPGSAIGSYRYLLKYKTWISELVQTTCFLNNLHQVTFKIDRLERLIIKCFGSNKPKRSKQDSQHRLSYLCLRDDNLTCINNHIILELYILVINISNKPCQCRSTDYWTDNTPGD